MNNYVFFKMWGPLRLSLIKGHQFYVEQARERLLSQFANMEAEAEKASAEWLEKSSDRFDPDRHDPSDFYEAANDAGIEFYQLLSDMRDQTRLSVIAGMFHEWEKQLRDWLVREIQHWHHGDTASAKVWSADFGKIADLLESFGWKIRSSDYFSTLDACRLVVNVYKHGDGPALRDLRLKHSEYLEDRLSSSGLPGTFDLVDYTNLKITDEQFQAFSDAIVAFWRNVPDRVVGSQLTQIPEWLKKAIQSDNAVGSQ